MKKSFINALVFISFSMLCGTVICNSTSASKNQISSKDLAAVMDRYLDQLVKIDPTGLPVGKKR